MADERKSAPPDVGNDSESGEEDGQSDGNNNIDQHNEDAGSEDKRAGEDPGDEEGDADPRQAQTKTKKTKGKNKKSRKEVKGKSNMRSDNNADEEMNEEHQTILTDVQRLVDAEDEVGVQETIHLEAELKPGSKKLGRVGGGVIQLVERDGAYYVRFKGFFVANPGHAELSIFLTRCKPNGKLPKINQVGVRVYLDGGIDGLIRGSETQGDFEQWADISDPFQFKGVAVAKPPRAKPPTPKPEIYAFGSLAPYVARVDPSDIAAALFAKRVVVEQLHIRKQAALANRVERRQREMRTHDRIKSLQGDSIRAFKQFDLDSSGEINFKEFQAILVYLGVHLLKHQARAFFNNVDMDGSGSISRRELEVVFYMLDTTDFTTTLAITPFDAFSIFDGDNDGALSFPETKVAFSLLGITVADRRLHGMMKKLADAAEAADAAAAAGAIASAEAASGEGGGKGAGRRLPRKRRRVNKRDRKVSLLQFKELFVQLADCPGELASRGVTADNGVTEKARAYNRTLLLKVLQGEEDKAAQSLIESRTEAVLAIRKDRQKKDARHRKKRELSKRDNRAARRSMAVKERLLALKREKREREVTKAQQSEEALREAVEKEAKARKDQAAALRRHDLERVLREGDEERVRLGKDRLDLSGCTPPLRAIPSVVYTGRGQANVLQNLLVLDISHNEIEELPGAGFLFKLSSVRKLDACRNQLKTLPAEIGDLTQCQVLRLHENILEQLPRQLGLLTALQRVSLNNNLLTTLPPEIGALQLMHSLTLYGNRINDLPDEFGDLSSLTDLDLSHNQLSILPDSFSRLTSLTRLRAAHNVLENFPLGFGRLRRLLLLDVSSNQLQHLPASLGKLKNLQMLNLSYNAVEAVPPAFKSLGSLVNLDLSHNAVQIMAPYALKGMSALETLHLQNNKLSVLPHTIGHLRSLTDLNARSNRFVALPKEFGACFGLTTLDFSHNRLVSLPEETGCLSKLGTLQLDYNALPSLPLSMHHLNRLHTLSACNNVLTSVHPSLGLTPRLTRLDLSCNRIKVLPAEMGCLSLLTTLNLAANAIHSLPMEISNMVSLETLDLYNNRLRAMPMQLSLLFPKLAQVNVDRNPLKFLPRKWCSTWTAVDQYRTLWSSYTNQEVTDWLLRWESVYYSLTVEWWEWVDGVKTAATPRTPTPDEPERGLTMQLAEKMAARGEEELRVRRKKLESRQRAEDRALDMALAREARQRTREALSRASTVNSNRSDRVTTATTITVDLGAVSSRGSSSRSNPRHLAVAATAASSPSQLQPEAVAPTLGSAAASVAGGGNSGLSLVTNPLLEDSDGEQLQNVAARVMQARADPAAARPRAVGRTPSLAELLEGTRQRMGVRWLPSMEAQVRWFYFKAKRQGFAPQFEYLPEEQVAMHAATEERRMRERVDRADDADRKVKATYLAIDKVYKIYNRQGVIEERVNAPARLVDKARRAALALTKECDYWRAAANSRLAAQEERAYVREKMKMEQFSRLRLRTAAVIAEEEASGKHTRVLYHTGGVGGVDSDDEGVELDPEERLVLVRYFMLWRDAKYRRMRRLLGVDRLREIQAQVAAAEAAKKKATHAAVKFSLRAEAMKADNTAADEWYRRHNLKARKARRLRAAKEDGTGEDSDDEADRAFLAQVTARGQQSDDAIEIPAKPTSFSDGLLLPPSEVAQGLGQSPSTAAPLADDASALIFLPEHA